MGPGEAPEKTAGRGVLEGTGLEIDVGERLGSTRYGFQSPDGRWNGKVVDWFVGWRVGGDVRLEPIFHEAAFFGREEALGLLTFPADRELARRAFAASARSRDTPPGVA